MAVVGRKLWVHSHCNLSMSALSLHVTKQPYRSKRPAICWFVGQRRVILPSWHVNSPHSAETTQQMHSKTCPQQHVYGSVDASQFESLKSSGKEQIFFLLQHSNTILNWRNVIMRLYYGKCTCRTKILFMLAVLCFPKYISSQAHSSGCQHSSSTHQLFKPNVCKEQPIKLNFWLR